MLLSWPLLQFWALLDGTAVNKLDLYSTRSSPQRAKRDGFLAPNARKLPNPPGNSSLEIVENGRNSRSIYVMHTIFVLTNVSNYINVSLYS